MLETKYYIQIDDTKTPNKVVYATTNPAELEDTLSYVDVEHGIYINVVGWLLQKREVIIKDGQPTIKEERKQKKNK